MIKFINKWLIKQFTKPLFYAYPPRFEEIKTRYKEHSWGLFGGNTDIILLFFTYLIAVGEYVNMVLDINNPYPVGSGLGALITPISLYAFLCYFKKKLVLFLHDKLPRRLPREAEVLVFFNRLRQEMNSEVTRPLEPPPIHPVITDWQRLGVKKFCQKYFNKKGSGFISFFLERTLKDRELNADFLFYAVSIPKKKELSIDSFRKILLAYQHLHLSMPLDLEQAFSNYKLNEIEVLFTNPYNRNYLLHLHDVKPVPVARDFFTLKEKLKEISIPEEIKALNGREIEGMVFKVLLNRADYDQASRDFNNCARSYWDRKEVLITVYSPQGEAVACLSIFNKEILDIKSVSNIACYEAGRIGIILQQEKVI